MHERDNKYEIQMMRVIFICFTHKVQLNLKRNLSGLKLYPFDGLNSPFYLIVIPSSFDC